MIRTAPSRCGLTIATICFLSAHAASGQAGHGITASKHSQRVVKAGVWESIWREVAAPTLKGGASRRPSSGESNSDTTTPTPTPEPLSLRSIDA